MTSRSESKWPTDPIVKDLDPNDLQRAPAPRPLTALEIIRKSVAKIQTKRNSVGLFADVKDDLPWEN